MARGARRERKGKRRQRPFSKAGKRNKAEGRLDDARFALRGGDPHRAFEVCRAVLADQSDNVDALSLAGVAAYHAGLADEAFGLLTLAVDHDPTHAESWTNLGNMLVHRGETDAAIEAYQTAMAADPDYPESHFNFATLMENLGHLPQALQAYHKTLEKAADHEPARHGMGNVLKSLGRLVEAKAVYEETLERSPSQPAVRANLAAVLHELGDLDGAAAQCRRALATAPTLLEARYNLGLALQELERFDEAREAYERTIAIDPDFAKPQVNLADLNLQLGDPDAALSVCDCFLSDHPGNTDLLAFKAIALGDAGRGTEAAALVDFGRLLHAVDVELPPDYRSLDAFNGALVAHLLDHPTLTPSPLSHATRDGRHSGELLSDPRGPFADFEQIVRVAADTYRTNLGRDDDHAFLAAPPERLDLSVWGVVMKSGGHQIPHIHPAAWMSGVYYAEVPDEIGEDGHAGWLEFGRPPGHFHNRTTPPLHAVRPKAGLMVLFPSYFYHHTIPFEMDQRRISIAFDLIPADG